MTKTTKSTGKTPEKVREKIVLIDGSGYFFRAFFAIQRLTNSKGFPTNAIYGFINMLMRVLEVEKPKHLGIVFDTPKPSFRKERYSEYKANRDKPPDDLVKQIPHILRSVDCFGIPRFEAEGFEADDVIGTLARRAVAEGYAVEIITGDKDLMQLVNEHVTLYDTMKDKRTDIAGVKEKWGVTPAQVIDLLALMGDSSDNIPGVSGIGEKTAQGLLQEYGSIDGIYARIDEIKKAKQKETLLAEKEIAYLSRELATVHLEVPLDVSWADLEYKGPEEAKLKPFLEEFEFHALMKRLNFKKEEKTFAPGNYETISTHEKLKELVARLEKATYICLDTETTSLAIHSADVCGISLAYEPTKGYYLPLGHHIPGAPHEKLAGQLDPEKTKAILKPLLENPKIPKIGQNLKYDIQILRRFGIDVKGIAADTMIASYLLDPDQPHNLDALALRHLGHQNITYEEVTGTGKNQLNFAEVTIEKATSYSGEDVDVTLRVNDKIAPEIKAKGLSKLYEEVELPLLEVLADIEYRGVRVDEAALKRMSTEIEVDIEAEQKKIFELAGEPININSPKQLSKILFEKLKLPIVKKTKTGISTDEAVLTQLAKEHDICRHILKFREYMKLKGTYIEGLLAQIHPVTKRVHTNYQQAVAATGRLSSTDPNLQNIPAAADSKYDIRSAFVPEPGYLMLSADYSQVELRLLADMSGDRALVKAFESGEDVHESTAKNIFGVTEVTPDQRKIAKTINFGVIYGQTPYGLSQQLGISPSEAKEFIDKYFAKYADVKNFLRSLAQQARDRGYAVTKLGRRRYFPEISSENRMRREMAERAAINAPIQGSAADLIKVAMVDLYRALQKEGLAARMLMQVHDELVFEVQEKDRDRTEKMVRDLMEGALDLKLRPKVDVGWGKNWRECG